MYNNIEIKKVIANIDCEYIGCTHNRYGNGKLLKATTYLTCNDDGIIVSYACCDKCGKMLLRVWNGLNLQEEEDNELKIKYSPTLPYQNNSGGYFTIGDIDIIGCEDKFMSLKAIKKMFR